MTDTITQVSLPSGNYLFVKVPKGSSFFIDDVFFWLRFRLFVNFKTVPYHNAIKLPDGNKYTIIGISETLTDEQWGKIVERTNEKIRNPYFCYTARYSPAPLFYTQTESGHSLVKSQSMDIDTTLIIKID